MIANLREPALQVLAETAKKRRTAERRIKRLEVRLKRANGVIRNLTVAKGLNISPIKVPARVPTDDRFDANQDRRLVAVGKPAQAAVAGVPHGAPPSEDPLRAIASARTGRDDARRFDLLRGP